MVLFHYTIDFGSLAMCSPECMNKYHPVLAKAYCIWNSGICTQELEVAGGISSEEWDFTPSST